MNIFYPLQLIADYLTELIFSASSDNLLSAAFNFFFFDTVKIFILLGVIIFVVSLLRSYLPPEKIKAILAHKNKYVGHLLAALLGIITPFCSCSAVPLFLGFIEAGVPLGITLSFLIASPMINEVALILLLGMFGWKIALLYVTSGLIIAILAGVFIGRLKAEKLIKSISSSRNDIDKKITKTSPRDRHRYAYRYTLDIFKKVWPYIIIGVGLGALIHGYVPADFLVNYAGADKWYAVPFAVIIGIPLYTNAAGVIPLVSALSEKGLAIGTTLAFMMSVTALSLPEFMILKRVMHTKLILIFAGVVGLGIIITGLLFNLFIH